MSDAAPPVRWSPMLTGFLGVLGALVTVGGLLITIGGWQGKLDTRVDSLERRMDTAEANQRTYIPVLIGMQKDISYLAERARRDEDEGAGRERRR